MGQDNLTAEQWQAIAEKLAEYLNHACIDINCDNQLCGDCPLFRIDGNWIGQAKKELGYE